MMNRLRSSILACLAVFSASVCAGPEPAPDPGRSVFTTPGDLAAVGEPVVCILNIQHEDIVRRQLDGKPVGEYSGWKLRERMQAYGGLRCVMVHFTEVRGEDLDLPHVRAILITGRNTKTKVVGHERDDLFFPLIRTTRIPVIGFCGGMQLIAMAHGAEAGPLRDLREGETDPLPGYHPGQMKEWGYRTVRIVRRDPLFEGLPDEITVRQAHAFQILGVPPGMELLASSPECETQAVRHRDRLVYGTQFHPEVHDEDHPHGRVVVENFFRLAGLGAARDETPFGGAP